MISPIRSFLSLLTSGCLLFLMAVPPSIGVVKSTGDFQLDGSTVSGNATLFEGSTVQTAAAQSKIQLSSGAEIVLAPNSRAQVYKSHLEAATLRISPTGTHAVAEIVAQDGNHVSVSATQGLVDVRNGAGVLVAVVHPGLALAFTAQTGGATTSVKMKGRLVQKGDQYFLTDDTTNVTVQLQGTNLAKEVGHVVEVEGTIIPDATPAAGATQVVQVVNVHAVSHGGAAAGGAAAGLSTGVIVAIVAGVAAVAVTVGLAASGTFSGKSSSSTP
ncbi:MAG: hypothetical protein ABSH24_18965 [Bryobacteraceae bacterium]|jgi:hypothetical protein